MKYLFVICTIILCSSCQNKERIYLLDTVKKWEGKVVRFPVNPVFTKYMRDTVDNTIESDLKLMVYVDSTGCTSCKLQLHKWKEYLHKLDSISGGNMSLLFYVCPKDKKEFEQILKRDRFDYPVCVDENDSLNLINNFSADPRFQVFILDSVNRIIALGNPILNPRIKDLYFNIFSSKNYIDVNQSSHTKVCISEQMINFDTFSWKESINKEVYLKNIGNSPLVINEIITSCGCVDVDYDKKPVLPEDSTSIKIEYRAEHPEHFSKTITIYCNAEGAPFELKISGNAR